MSSRRASKSAAPSKLPAPTKRKGTAPAPAKTLASDRSKRLNVTLTERAQFIDETEDADEQEYQDVLAARKGRKPKNKENRPVIPPGERAEFTSRSIPTTRASNPVPSSIDRPSLPPSTAQDKTLSIRVSKVPPAPRSRTPEVNARARNDNSRKLSSPEAALRVAKLKALRDPFAGPSLTPRAPSGWSSSYSSPKHVSSGTHMKGGAHVHDEYDEVDADPNADLDDDEYHNANGHYEDFDQGTSMEVYDEGVRDEDQNEDDDENAEQERRCSPVQQQRRADAVAVSIPRRTVSSPVGATLASRSGHNNPQGTAITSMQPPRYRKDARMQGAAAPRSTEKASPARKRKQDDADGNKGLPRKAQKVETSSSARGAVRNYEPGVQEVIYTAFVCFEARITCKNAYPDAVTEVKWARLSWREACQYHSVNIEADPGIIRLIRNRSWHLRCDITAKVKISAESIFGLEDSPLPSVIKANARIVKDLKTKNGMYYRVCHGANRVGMFQHRGIQRIVNRTYYRDSGDAGLILPSCYSPFPVLGIAMILTGFDAALDEWISGTRSKITFNDRYKPIYRQHCQTIQEFIERPGGEAMLLKICETLAETGRRYAGVEPTELEGDHEMSPNDFDAAIAEFTKSGLVGLTEDSDEEIEDDPGHEHPTSRSDDDHADDERAQSRAMSRAGREELELMERQDAPRGRTHPVTHTSSRRDTAEDVDMGGGSRAGEQDGSDNDGQQEAYAHRGRTRRRDIPSPRRGSDEDDIDNPAGDDEEDEMSGSSRPRQRRTRGAAARRVTSSEREDEM